MAIGYPEILLAIACFFIFHTIKLGGRCWLPLNFPIIGCCPYLILNFHRVHDWYTDLLRDAGCSAVLKPPAAAGFDYLFTCDPANVHHVFSSNFSNYAKGDDFFDMFDFLGGGIFNSDHDPWKFQRKKAHSLLSSPRFRSFAVEVTRAKVETGLIPHLNLLAQEGRALDLQDVFLRLTHDTSSTLVFGIDPGCMSIDLPNNPFSEAMLSTEEVFFYRHIGPSSWWKLARRLNVWPEKQMPVAAKVIESFIAQCISRRRTENKGGRRDDLLSSYLDSQAEIEKSGFGFDKFLRDTTLNLMVAGGDTTSSALSWFFWLVAKNPKVESKIVEELRANSPSELPKLVYLHAAVCESLRLFPPVPLEHKRALQPDVLPSGVGVHDRRRIIFSSYAMGRMEGIWGKDCLEFRPERWIDPVRGRIRYEPSYKFFAFNSGPRLCLGKEMAFTQLKMVAAAVIGNFHVEVVEGFVPRPKLSIILHMKDGLMVRVRKRGA